MGWYEALASALDKEDVTVMQIATLEAPDRPRVRSHIHRAFLSASTLPTLPLLVTTTDVRTPKVAQLAADPIVEAVYWTPRTQQQFRVLGRAAIVPAPGWDGAYPTRRGVVCAALDREGFDWETYRRATFDALGGHMRATWCRPIPGTPLTRADEPREWPERLPRTGEARDEGERRAVARALGNFAVVLIEAVEVDHLELASEGGLGRERRTRYVRDWEDEGSVEFRETAVVP